MEKFDLLIFDCDGVLVDSEPLSALAHQNVYAAHGHELRDEMMARCVGMKQKDIFALIERETGAALPAHADQLVWREVQRLMHEKLEPTPGIIPFLQRNSTPRCVASSSAMERIILSLQITHVAAQFQPGRLFNSAMVQHGKPAPDLFLHAASQCKTAPARCAVFEDSIYGVQGAVAAGMTAFGYVGGGHIKPGHEARLIAAGAARVFSSWAEAEAHLAG